MAEMAGKLYECILLENPCKNGLEDKLIHLEATGRNKQSPWKFGKGELTKLCHGHATFDVMLLQKHKALLKLVQVTLAASHSIKSLGFEQLLANDDVAN